MASFKSWVSIGDPDIGAEIDVIVTYSVDEHSDIEVESIYAPPDLHFYRSPDKRELIEEISEEDRDRITLDAWDHAAQRAGEAAELDEAMAEDYADLKYQERMERIHEADD